MLALSLKLAADEPPDISIKGRRSVRLSSALAIHRTVDFRPEDQPSADNPNTILGLVLLTISGDSDSETPNLSSVTIATRSRKLLIGDQLAPSVFEK